VEYDLDTTTREKPALNGDDIFLILHYCYGFASPGLDTCLGGAALALGVHRLVFCTLVALLLLPLFFRFVVLV
jgi:hypothetical protein